MNNIIKITKVKEEFGWMSCMSPHPVEFKGIKFRTAEAMFQYMRFEGHPEVQKEIFEQRSPMGAKMKARKNRELLKRGEKWDEHSSDLSLMKQCLLLKLDQHPDLKDELIKTGNAKIVEDCTTHDRESARYWGMVKKDGKWIGENHLGKIWMDIRTDLQNPKP